MPRRKPTVDELQERLQRRPGFRGAARELERLQRTIDPFVPERLHTPPDGGEGWTYEPSWPSVSGCGPPEVSR